jgi:DNA polymerase III alpha subunit
MKTGTDGSLIMSEHDIMELMYQEKSPGEIFVEDALFETLTRSTRDLSIPLPFKISIHKTRSADDMTDAWRMPDAYRDLDIDLWFAERVSTVEQAERVANELALYRSGGLYPLLRFLIYLVDLMREQRIVWGVGRGSSVASYCLFLIGIHKIDSMRYNLDIKEFLKWQIT